MTGKTHLLYGIGTGILGATYLSIVHESSMLETGIFIVSCSFGSVYPDIDNPKSMVNKINPFPKMMNKIFGHRGFIHSPINLILLYFFMLWIWEQLHLKLFLFFVYGFAIGFLFHIVLDMFTKGGIPLFYPLSRKRYRLLKMKSGSKYERLVSLILFIFIFIGVVFLITFHDEIYVKVSQLMIFRSYLL